MSTTKHKSPGEQDQDTSPSAALERNSEATAQVSNHRRLWIGAGACALIGGAAFSTWRQQYSQPQDEAVKTLLQQSYPLAGGFNGSVDSKQAGILALNSLKDKTVILNFWATWCPPCVEEMPDLSKLAETWHREFGEKVMTLGIGIDSLANIEKFSQKLPVSYPLLAANAQGLELIRLLGNPNGGLPFSIIINRRGLVVERISGRFDVKKLDFTVRKVLAS
jgi:thiol-disulfide isomerase/thioredoxin